MITDPIVRINKEIETLQHFVDFGWYLDAPADRVRAKVAIQNLKDLVFLLQSVPK